MYTADLAELQRAGSEPLRSLRGLSGWLFFFLVGSAFSRSFYYLGIPSVHLFIGEIFLLVAIGIHAGTYFDRWMRYLINPSLLGMFTWCLLLSVFYGIFEVIYGTHAEYPVIDVLKILVVNLYPFYLYLGLWVGAEHPALLRKVVHAAAWILAIYGPLYLLILNQVRLTIPGTDAPVFPQPGGGGVIILSLLALERRSSRFWPLILMAAIMMLAIQVRSEWVGALLALTTWGLLERRFAKVSFFALLIAALLGIGVLADVNLPSPSERGGRISSREIVARGLSVVAPDLAQEYSSAENVRFYRGTMYWRLRWWDGIWVSSKDSLTVSLFGQGYGYPLGRLDPGLGNENIRTPHSIFFFLLGYSGWTGVLLFGLLQFSIVRLAWNTFRRTKQAWGVAFCMYGITNAFFGNYFESPMGAIPYYLWIGLFAGPAILLWDNPSASPTLAVERGETPPFCPHLPAKESAF